MNNRKNYPKLETFDVFICTIGDLNSPSRSLIRCIKSIKHSDIPINRIIVLSKKIYSELQNFMKKEDIILLKQKNNKPLGYHRAECIRLSQTKWCLFVDDDIYIQYNWYSKVKPYIDDRSVAFQGCKVFEKKSESDFLNEVNNLILYAKYKRNYKEKSIHCCSFENTLINTDLIKKHHGDKILEKFDSGEDWALFNYFKDMGYSWRNIPNLYVVHNYLSSNQIKKKIEWHDESNILPSQKIMLRFFVSFWDLWNIIISSIKKIIDSIIVLFYAIFIYLKQRWYNYKSINKGNKER
jgi:hypothetical protein